MNILAQVVSLALLSASAHAQFLRGFVKVENPLGLDLVTARINDAVLCDLDDDGDLDIAVLISQPIDSPSDPPNDTRYFIRVYANDSGGHFSLATTIDIRDGDGLRFDLEAGDLNNDGLPELVTTSRRVPDAGPFDDKLVVTFNLGGLSFFNPVYFTSPGAYHGIAIADMDNDGDTDILTASAFNWINYHRGNGSGLVFNLVDQIETGNGSTTGDSPDEIEVADFNLDGRPDIAVSNFDSLDISMLYQRSNGQFWDGLLTTIVSHGRTNPTGLRAHDINADSEPDLILATTSNPLLVLYNDYDAGDESFPNFNDQSADLPNTAGSQDLLFDRIDCTGDAIVDLVSADRRVDVFVGLGGDSFSSTPLYTSPEINLFSGVARVLSGDIDLDGDTDILHVDRAGNFFGGRDIVLLRNRCTELPCPADLSDDRILNFFDVSFFLSAYTSGDLSADFNMDGVLNFFDVSAFLSAFSEGCPD